MTASRDPDSLIRAFLDEGRTELPERAYAAVREHIDHTSQRVVIGPWRTPFMSKFAGLAAGAAAVVAVGLLGATLLGSGSGTGPAAGPTAVPSSSPSAPEPLPTAVILPKTGALTAGTTYRIVDPLVTTVPFTFTLDDGWTTIDYAILKKQAGDDAERTMTFSPWVIEQVYRDVCSWDDGFQQPLLDDSVGMFVEALEAQGGRTATVTDVSLDGHEGQRVELTVDDDLVPSECHNGVSRAWTDSVSGGSGGYILGPGQRDAVYAVDVDGQRFVLHTSWPPGTTGDDLAELDAMVRSIRFETPVNSE